MKKICLTVVAASAMLFSAQPLTAQETIPQQVPVEEQVPVEDAVQEKGGFIKIETLKLPEEVKQAIERDYAGAIISEAHVKEKQGEKKFKILLTTENGELKELYADSKGKWIDKAKKKKDEEI